MEKVESCVYQIENYFILANVQNENVKAGYAKLLLIKSATIQLYARAYDLQTFTWYQLKTDVIYTFKPAEYHSYAYDELAENG